MAFCMIYTVLNSFIIITMAQSLTTPPNSEDNISKHLSASCNDFTKNLYKELSSDYRGNVVNSPLSIHMILSYLSHGAESTTLNELTKSLYHYDKDSIQEGYRSLITQLNELEDIKLYIANSIYIQDEFELLMEFLTIGREFYQSEISKIDFKNIDAAEKINSWVKQKTNNKISNLVSSDDFDENIKLVLINAIYFNGSWLNTFNAKNTKDKIFHVTRDQTKLVPTMFNKSQYNYGNIPILQAKFIEIPYTNTDIVMIIILPNEIDGLLNLQTNFSWEILTNASRLHGEIELYLPKFKIEFTVDLKNILSKLGVSKMFSHDANFKRISSVPLMVNKILHKAVIEINEEGTEAAAATAVHLRLRRSMANELEQFLVDRPFMFVIEYKPKNVPLFIGSVQDIGVASQKDEL
ncbi:antichymotrypsin-2-like isoform X1 [Frieseomelitta varia]|uniref:antichymotrypsin-2-like isoform X1 n=2 Tax=Frieseomelitta varia TaxID=561572 RepID=UPI001CB68DB3|nr:antichymotrypsin-2-like isoform X1 [Frieseomelitta varia]XP_043520443.1 antichymotrypsin-2-like isoform X1 [Frieseomelitta varia]XP_043520445.1 antichymotrypsin-2-like isoform X1 [Frieseomelitta varia]